MDAYFVVIPFVIANLVLNSLPTQISEQASSTFEEIMRQDRIPIDMGSPLEPMSLSEYIEDCRMKLWDHAFLSTFKGHDCFKKSDDFLGFKGADLVVRRVLFRFENFEVLVILISNLVYHW